MLFSSPKSVSNSLRESERLSCSINNDFKNGCSSSGRAKGRGSQVCSGSSRYYDGTLGGLTDEGDKRFCLGKLLRDWEDDIVCL